MIVVVGTEDYEILKQLGDELTKSSVYSNLFYGFSLTKEMFDVYTKDPKEKVAVLSKDEEGNILGFGVFDIIPWLYNDHPTRIARLAYIYVKPENRGKGVRQEIEAAFEYWGKLTGAKYYSIGITKDFDKTEKVVVAKGYDKIETIFMKEVK